MESRTARLVGSYLLLLLGAGAFLIVLALAYPIQAPESPAASLQVLGEAAIVASLLALLVVVIRFTDADPMFRLLAIGSGLLAVSAVADLADEFIALPTTLGIAAEHVFGALGGILLLLGVYRWSTAYLERGGRLTSTEHQLADRNERLALLGRLVRHDIRNDMLVVASWADQLGGDVPDRHQEPVEQIADAADHAIELTSAVSRLTAVLASEETDTEPIDLASVLSGEIQYARKKYPDADIECDEPPDPVYVRADTLLGPVIGNLIENAVEHNDTDRPSVSVAVSEDDDTITLDVADDGPGIPPDQRADLFTGDLTEREHAGMGLGLYLVDTLVDQYGGSVVIDENEPRGCHVSVTLDRAAEPNAESRVLESSPNTQPRRKPR